MMRARTAYNALLRCYPAPFRDEYGNQMFLVFAEQLREAQRRGSRFAQAGLWVQAAADALLVAPREHLHVILQDVRYAFRVMAASPTFSVVAILSLALGIGANTAIFSLWNGVLHAPLPGVQKPEQLVMLSDPDQTGMWSGRWDGRTDGPRAWLTYGEFERMRDHADAFSMLMASQSSFMTWQVRVDGTAGEEVRGRLVSGAFFQVLGVKPAIGRVFTSAEDGTDAAGAVISYAYWQRRFGGRTDVLGTTLGLPKAIVTVIGVTPAGFIGETSGQQPDIWLPLRMQPSVVPGRDWLHDTPPDKVMWLQVFGRLKQGVTPAQAEAQADALFQADLESFYGAIVSPERKREFLDQHLRIWPGARGASATRRKFSTSLTALLAAVGVLLLIACANLANLLLARGAARKAEIAVRLSLGASRERLIRQLVTESLVLAVMGGAAAMAVASLLHGVLVRMVAQSDPRFHLNFALNPLILAFVLAVTLAAALLFGVLPAWQATRADAGATLKEQTRGAIGSLGQARSGRVLVSLQLALSLPLLVGAGLLVRTVYNLQRADLGFPAERLLLVRIDLREIGDDVTRRDNLVGNILEELKRIPDVRAASFSQLGVFSGGNSSTTIQVEGYSPKGDFDRGSDLDVVGPRYFSTLGVPILLGREILESDVGDAPAVCVINEAFARRFFDRRNPIGMRVTHVEDANARKVYRVIGLVKNAHAYNDSLRGDVEPRYYVSASQPPAVALSPTFLIRTTRKSETMMGEVRRAIQRVDAALPILSARSIEDQIAPLMAQDRITAQLVVVFGGVALMLAAIGLYGVLSYGISRRTKEIAIRIALGARSRGVISMILRETMVIALAGLVLGLGLAYAASRLVHNRLYGVAPQDPLTLLLATSLLLLVALIAAFVPARRASKLDPMAALRQG